MCSAEVLLPLASPICSVKMATSPSKGCAPVVLLMVGPVGSGKSTFAGRLIQQGQAQWVRVNQVTEVLPDSCQVLSACLVECHSSCPERAP